MNGYARHLGPGLCFLGCGITFLAVGAATGRVALASAAPALLALGIVFIARALRRGPRP